MPHPVNAEQVICALTCLAAPAPAAGPAQAPHACSCRWRRWWSAANTLARHPGACRNLYTGRPLPCLSPAVPASWRPQLLVLSVRGRSPVARRRPSLLLLLLHSAATRSRALRQANCNRWRRTLPGPHRSPLSTAPTRYPCHARPVAAVVVHLEAEIDRPSMVWIAAQSINYNIS